MATAQPPTAGSTGAPPTVPSAPPAARPPSTMIAPPPGPPRAPAPAAPPATAQPPTVPAPERAPAPPVRPVIDVAARYREIGTIRLLALIFMFIAASLSVLDSFYVVGGIVPLSGVGIGLTAGAIVCGFIAIINQKNRRLNNITTILAASLMIAGIATRPILFSIGKLSLGSADFLLALLFAIFFLLFLEYMHGVRRFWEIGEMAIEKNLREFDFGYVLRQYILMGFVWLVVVIIITMAVIGIQLALIAGLPAQIGQSAEMNSVYGLAIAEGLLFVILGVIVSLFMGRQEMVQSFRAVTTRAPPPSPAGPMTVQTYTPGRGPAPTGLSATAPPPRAR